jgi:ABC-type bacteriocin/lantibiotic exporter with double-glycine peptidase domain
MFALALVLVVAFDCLFRLVKVRLLSRIAGRIDLIVGVAVLKKLLRLPPGRMETSPLEAQLTRMREFESIRDVFTGPLALAITELPFTVLILVVLFVIAGPLAFIPLVGLALGGLPLLGVQWQWCVQFLLVAAVWWLCLLLPPVRGVFLPHADFLATEIYIKQLTFHNNNNNKN